jgi:glycerol-3-phosphate dehydrogenase (NAD(P)+)
MKKMYSVGVIGSGSWGTTLANLLAKNSIDTHLYVRKKALFETIKKTRQNSIYLPSVKLSESLNISNSIEEVMKRCDVLLLSVPVKYLRESLLAIKPYVRNNHIFINSSKGIENDTFFRPSDIVKDVLGIESSRFALISGPNFAKEVAQELPAATVVASKNDNLAKTLQVMFSNSYFRAYTASDVAGIEIAAAVKNVIAIAVGVSDGLGFGNNAKASLITRGLAEISRIGLMFGAKLHTFMGLAGMGDLVLTATGDLSRNRRFGFELSKNRTADEILSSMVMIAEGVNTVKSIFYFSKQQGIDMPISKKVYEIIYENKNPEIAAAELMERPLKKENY